MNKTLRNLALVAAVALPASAFAEVAGTGTAADPYIIATAEDLCGAHSLMKTAEITYFVQTADIDMTGVTEYTPLNGSDGATYTNAFNYDGRNHVIKNFAPTTDSFTSPTCYGQSVFGVVIGTLKNVGVVDANVKSDAGNQAVGIFGGYVGHADAAEIAPVTTIEHCYATGKAEGKKYTGGLFGTTGSAVNVKDCFANVTIKGNGGNVGGLFGKITKDVNLDNVYVAGSIETSVTTVGLIADPQGGTVKATNVVAFNTGAQNTYEDVTLANTDASKAAGVAAVKAWAAFDGEEVDGLPGLGFGMSGEGTAENPYIIYSAEALCNAYKGVDGSQNKEYFFVQTEDIDMKSVTDYHAINGYDGQYKASINYDGQNHTISNFCPDDAENVAGTTYYYCTSIFGVCTGIVKNLGVVDAYIGTAQGAGILGAYFGHGDATQCETSKLENVYVTGEVDGEGGYTGAFFGTNATAFEITNCFANAEVSGKTCTGGFIGRLRTDGGVAKNVYVAGTVKGDAPYLVGDTDKESGVTLTATNFIAFNTGATAACSAAVKATGIEVATDATKADLIKKVQGWEGFSATELVDGYPALDADAPAAGINAITVDSADAPAAYYNLQGVQVANPANGIYVRVANGKATKVLVK